MPRLFCAPIISLMLFTFSFIIPGTAAAAITDFKGTPQEGQTGAVQFSWNFDGPQENVKFHLFVYRTEDILSGIGEMDGTARSFVAHTSFVKPVMKFLLIAMQGDRSVAEAATIVQVNEGAGFSSFTAADAPYDGGSAVEVTWTLSEGVNFKNVEVYRSPAGENKWEKITVADASAGKTTVEGETDGTKYDFKLRGTGGDFTFESTVVEGVITVSSWFDMRKINLLIILIVMIVPVCWYIIRSGKKKLFIRKIAGLQAVEEAVGRATEMGRSVLFVPGINDLDDVQTLAGLTILGSVAKITAQYETRLDVPVCRSIVMSTGREVVKESYLSVGRPDFYNDDIVHYITDEQFGYVAGVDGIMAREKPAACFYMGAFFAESLILAENGNSVGAIQIAGTAMPSQLPFFVAACDYTLIGEELFAASAYLSNDQKMIGTLRGQDIGKAIAMISIAAGVFLVTIQAFIGHPGWFGSMTAGLVRVFALNY